MSDPIRFEVRTKRGLRGTTAGGSWAEESSRKVALLEMLATVLRTDRDQLEIISGANERTMLIEWTDPPVDGQERIDNWRQTK